jgi:hypothetical protein
MNPKSIIFLLILLCVVLFFIGINLGKTIEKINKTQPVITPINKPIPTLSLPPMSFNTFKSNECGLSFLYPVGLKDEQISTQSVVLYHPLTDYIKYSCEMQDLRKFASDSAKKTVLKQITFDAKKVNVYSVKGHQIFKLTNPLTQKEVIFEISNGMVDLIMQTLHFTLIPTPTPLPSLSPTP